MLNLSAFKAYDIRGRIPDEINPDLIYQVGRAYAAVSTTGVPLVITMVCS